MKTLDEAFAVINKSVNVGLDEADKFKQTSREIFAHGEIRSMLSFQIAMILSFNQALGEDALMELAMVSFAVGVKIGMEMEKP